MRKVLAYQSFVRYALDSGQLKLVPEGIILKNGRVARYSFDLNLINNEGFLRKMVEYYVAISRSLKFDLVFSPSYKEMPLAIAISVMIGNVGWSSRDHSDEGIIIGSSFKDKRVLIIESVMESGESATEAVEIIKKQRGTAIGCIVAFDRQERSGNGKKSAVQEFQETHNIPVLSVVTVRDLIKVLRSSPNRSEEDMVPPILQCQREYGI